MSVSLSVSLSVCLSLSPISKLCLEIGDRETDRQTDREAGRQAGKQTDRTNTCGSRFAWRTFSDCCQEKTYCTQQVVTSTVCRSMFYFCSIGLGAPWWTDRRRGRKTETDSPRVLLGKSWGAFGESWGSPGRILGRLGVISGHLGPLLGGLGVVLAGLGALLGDLGVDFGALGGVLWRSCAVLQVFWPALTSGF